MLTVWSHSPYLGYGHLAHLGVGEHDDVPLQGDGPAAQLLARVATLGVELDGVGGRLPWSLVTSPHHVTGDGQTGGVTPHRCRLVEDGHSDRLAGVEEAGAEWEGEEGGLEDCSPLD